MSGEQTEIIIGLLAFMLAAIIEIEDNTRKGEPSILNIISALLFSLFGLSYFLKGIF